MGAVQGAIESGRIVSTRNGGRRSAFLPPSPARTPIVRMARCSPCGGNFREGQRFVRPRTTFRPSQDGATAGLCALFALLRRRGAADGRRRGLFRLQCRKRRLSSGRLRRDLRDFGDDRRRGKSGSRRFWCSGRGRTGSRPAAPAASASRNSARGAFVHLADEQGAVETFALVRPAAPGVWPGIAQDLRAIPRSTAPARSRSAFSGRREGKR